MKRQNDWYTGTNYYDNYSETQITIERKTIAHPCKSNFHEQVEMIYVLAGSGCITVNGCDYEACAGSFYCLYSHHFYEIHSITEKLQIISVKFFIGLFMYMSWEKHPKNANAKLMYDTRPMVKLKAKGAEKILVLFEELLREKDEARFGSLNLIIYKTLELHTYFCRYAYEEIGSRSERESGIWDCIKKILLASEGKLSLNDMASEFGCSDRALNQRIKATCGYTFFQLKQTGQLLNACALLHFPDLTMSYISDLTGFSSVTAFYRVFAQYCKLTPREYQRSYIASKPEVPEGSSLAMRLLQYIHLNFMHDITLQQLCDAFYVKPYTARHIFDNVFGMSYKELLSEIRVCYAASFLKTGRCSAIDAASICGFDSYSTFARAFKLYMNQTPEEYTKL
ncbi:MAG: AraC family transcriptional regulator [Oscillospiraceae bacterium]